MLLRMVWGGSVLRNHLHCLEWFEIQVVLTTSADQPIQFLCGCHPGSDQTNDRVSLRWNHYCREECGENIPLGDAGADSSHKLLIGQSE